jgi:hypothetical protein
MPSTFKRKVAQRRRVSEAAPPEPMDVDEALDNDASSDVVGELGVADTPTSIQQALADEEDRMDCMDVMTISSDSDEGGREQSSSEVEVVEGRWGPPRQAAKGEDRKGNSSEVEVAEGRWEPPSQAAKGEDRKGKGKAREEPLLESNIQDIPTIGTLGTPGAFRTPGTLGTPGTSGTPGGPDETGPPATVGPFVPEAPSLGSHPADLMSEINELLNQQMSSPEIHDNLHRLVSLGLTHVDKISTYLTTSRIHNGHFHQEVMLLII